MQNNLKIVKNYQKITDRLKKSQLVNISIKCDGMVLELEFTHGLGDEEIFIQCLNVIHFVFSKELDDCDGCYFVGNIGAKRLEYGGKESLEQLNYGFRELDGKETAYYPSKNLLHFYIEGGAYLQVICETIQASQL